MFVFIKEAGDSCDNVKDEVAGDIVVRNGLQFFVSSGLLHEIQKDLNHVNDVYCQFYFPKGLLRLAVFAIIQIQLLLG